MSIEWHGDRAYRLCRCGALVRVNKPIFGDLHICATDCEIAGGHCDVRERRRGLLWWRRTERWCERCQRRVS